MVDPDASDDELEAAAKAEYEAEQELAARASHFMGVTPFESILKRLKQERREAQEDAKRRLELAALRREPGEQALLRTPGRDRSWVPVTVIETIQDSYRSKSQRELAEELDLDRKTQVSRVIYWVIRKPPEQLDVQGGIVVRMPPGTRQETRIVDSETIAGLILPLPPGD